MNDIPSRFTREEGVEIVGRARDALIGKARADTVFEAIGARLVAGARAEQTKVHKARSALACLRIALRNAPGRWWGLGLGNFQGEVYWDRLSEKIALFNKLVRETEEER